MKRIIGLICCILLAIVPALADEETYCLINDDGARTGQTMVILTVAESYKLTIPASIPITYGYEKTEIPVGVSDLLLATGSNLMIQTASATGILSCAGTSTVIPYTVSYEDASALSFSQNGEKTVTVDIAKDDWYQADAGEYTGILTFSATIVR